MVQWWQCSCFDYPRFVQREGLLHFVANVDLPFGMIRNSYSTIHMKPFATCLEFCCSTCMARRRRNASPPKGLRWDSPGKRKVELKKTKTTSLLHSFTFASTLCLFSWDEVQKGRCSIS